MGSKPAHESVRPGTWEVPVAPSLGSIASPDYRMTASAITRDVKLCKGEPIFVPVLPEGAQVMAGQRGLSLAWTGGCPPYRLELKSDHGTLGVESGLASREFRFEHVKLKPGLYSVSIRDGAGVSANIPFTARVNGPMWPDALAANTTHIGTVARALWLAEVDQGIWRSDCVEMLMPLRREHDPLAEAVSERILSQGSTPVPSKERALFQ